MTLTVLGERPTDRQCEECGAPIIELLVRGTTLQNDWIIGICPTCQQQADREEGRKG